LWIARAKSSREASGQRGVSGSSSQQCLAMQAAGAGFVAGQECRSDLDGLGAEREGGR